MDLPSAVHVHVLVIAIGFNLQAQRGTNYLVSISPIPEYCGMQQSRVVGWEC